MDRPSPSHPPLRSAKGRAALRMLAPALLAVFLAVSAGSADAQQSADVRAMAQRLNSLEQALRDLQRAVYRGETPPPAAATAAPLPSDGISSEALSQRLVSNEQHMLDIEAELRRLTGAIETAVHQVDLIGERVDKLVADVDFRLAELERGAQGAAAGAPDEDPVPGQAGIARAAEQGGDAPAPGPTASLQSPQSILPEGTPDQQYAHARSLLTTLDYDAAEAAFKAFLERNGDHPLAGNAQYWLGETYYVRQNYAEAAAAFIAGYTQFPDGAKAPDNLLKLGMSLASLGSNEDACASFAELLAKYPEADQRLLQLAVQQREKIGCR